MSDIEIARAAVKKPIQEIGLKLGFLRLICCRSATTRRRSAIRSSSVQDREDGKLILVTAINPTPRARARRRRRLGWATA